MCSVPFLNSVQGEPPASSSPPSTPTPAPWTPTGLQASRPGPRSATSPAASDESGENPIGHRGVGSARMAWGRRVAGAGERPGRHRGRRRGHRLGAGGVRTPHRARGLGDRHRQPGGSHAAGARRSHQPRPRSDAGPRAGGSAGAGVRHRLGPRLRPGEARQHRARAGGRTDLGRPRGPRQLDRPGNHHGPRSPATR